MSNHPLPETLARIGGLSTSPSLPEDSVLLMIDGQREYNGLPFTGVAAAVEERARLLAFARARNLPVFHAIHHGRAGGKLFDQTRDGAKFIEALAPLPGEVVLINSLPNAFAGTALAALDHGFRSTVVANATSTRDLPHPFGAGITAAHIVQAGTLAALSDRFSFVIQDTAAMESAPAPAA